MSFCNIHSKPMMTIGSREVCSSCLGQRSLYAIQKSLSLEKKEADLDAMHRLAAARIPRLFSESTFECYETKSERQEKTVASLKRYADDFHTQRSMRPGLIFGGSPGVGKTHIACAIAKIVIGNGFSAKYVSLPDLTMRVRSSYKSDGISVAEIINELISTDFLILDEIDLHGSSDNDYQILYEIINGRYEQGNTPTLAISNRKVSELVNDLDERIISRILGSSKPVIFE